MKKKPSDILRIEEKKKEKRLKQWRNPVRWPLWVRKTNSPL